MNNGVNCGNAKVAMRAATPIRSQAEGSTYRTSEGSEARRVTSARNKRAHECPGPYRSTSAKGCEMVRHPGESRGAGLNGQRNGCDTSIRWAQVCYCVPQLTTPGKNIRLLNVGLASGAFAK